MVAREGEHVVALRNAIARASADSRPFRIYFVCTGNICRSPAAHAIFDHIVRFRRLEELFEVESAGTHGYHIGDNADPRMRRTCSRHGVPLNHPARLFEKNDLSRYDLIFAMDADHLRFMRQGATPEESSRVVLFRDFDEESMRGLDVPDPYYDSDQAFEEVFTILYRVGLRVLDAMVELASGEPRP